MPGGRHPEPRRISGWAVLRISSETRAARKLLRAFRVMVYFPTGFGNLYVASFKRERALSDSPCSRFQDQNCLREPVSTDSSRPGAPAFDLAEIGNRVGVRVPRPFRLGTNSDVGCSVPSTPSGRSGQALAFFASAGTTSRGNQARKSEALIWGKQYLASHPSQKQRRAGHPQAWACSEI